MAFINLSFEDAGASPGLALGWTYSTRATPFVIAAYGMLAEPWENFEREWLSNQNYVFNFAGLAADYQTLHLTPKPVENFEEFWDSNQAYLFALAGAAADYDVGTPQNFEDFEEEWSSNESYVYDFSAAATFTEDFESGWDTNEAYVYDFTGTAAMYDSGSNAFENFEGTWPTMTTI